MARQIGDLIAANARYDRILRPKELAHLSAALAEDGPRVVHLHGIAGIGKSTLLAMFAEHSRANGVTLLRLDCRRIEPTAEGFLRELSQAAGCDGSSLSTIADRLIDLGSRVVLALDTYERFGLLDTWLRQIFIPQLPDNVRIFLFGRERPVTAWYTTAGWHELFKAMELGALVEKDAVELLQRLGLPLERANEIAPILQGHPLALQLAASAMLERLDLRLNDNSLQHVLETLTQMFLEDVRDPQTRQALEAVSVTRRVTLSLLRALFPKQAPQDLYERLSRLAYVEFGNDGLVVHDAVREAILHSVKARDPDSARTYKRRAWQQLMDELGSASTGELWRYTADMLYLIENPVTREAFFPSGTTRQAVEPATSGDTGDIAEIIHYHEGPQAARILLSWWKRLPQSFVVVRGENHRPNGLCCRLDSRRVEPEWLQQDPITREWHDHLQRNPIPEQQTALFCRRWLSTQDGEAPGAEQASLWLDLKRTYLELRPNLRRVYLTVRDLQRYAPVAQTLGFEVLTGQEVRLDGHTYHSAVLDFGPASVDGWLSDLAARELGLITSSSELDPSAHELMLDGKAVSLTPLESGVMQHLLTCRGRAVSRGELLREVWGTRYEGGSNVVDTVVGGLRRKLGDRAERIETIRGVGYRMRG
ncbi:winged helix-turn-helix domain-containing protein [Marinobacterium sp. D7]|uniref:winged helix-turn-helix domain-containing protein n=1 Tax=Marinobacterium ramblicola TaxID=2849041 RepID=UPI001C2D09FB|nr:winged helix-turn-helix domain-containing protein [Marinobacterium ramblicola]MBV1786659.1 winged helix-turn-helix domain-containing protein [Marinobacterium ramblicola]